MVPINNDNNNNNVKVNIVWIAFRILIINVNSTGKQIKKCNLQIQTRLYSFQKLKQFKLYITEHSSVGRVADCNSIKDS